MPEENVTPNPTPAPPAPVVNPNPVSPTPKKSNMILWVLVVVVLLVILGVGGYFLLAGKSSSQSNSTQTVVTVTPTTTNTPAVSSEERVTVPIPQEADWLKYQASCSSLKNNITVFYPKDWQPNELEFPADTSQTGVKDKCTVVFGYGGKAVVNAQEPTPGVKAIIGVYTWVDNTQTLDQFTSNQTNNSNPGGLKFLKVVVNNQTYYKAELDSGFTYVTKKADRFFSIALPNKKGAFYPLGSKDIKYAVFDNSMTTLTTEFINRLKIL